MMQRFVVQSMFVALAAWISAPQLHAQERKLEPVDEAERDLSWAHFKNRLLDAVVKRDRKFVLSILDRNVRLA